MSDRTVIILALIALVIPLANIIMTYRTRQKLDLVHTQIDGMKTELVAATKAEGQAEGEATGRQKVIDETAERLVIRERGEDRAAGAVANHDHDPEALQGVEGVIVAAVLKALHDSGGFPKMEDHAADKTTPPK